MIATILPRTGFNTRTMRQGRATYLDTKYDIPSLKTILPCEASGAEDTAKMPILFAMIGIGNEKFWSNTYLQDVSLYCK